MIPNWFDPLAGLLVSLAAFGLACIVGPYDRAARNGAQLLRILCGVAVIAAVVLFAIVLIGLVIG
jgi:hypothetical protein